MSQRVSSAEARVLLGVGFAGWLLATVGFRVAGQVLLNPETPLVIGVLFGVTIPGMVILALGVFRWRSIDARSQPLAAILLVVPGMVLDAIALPLFDTVFPNMAAGAAPFFGGLLLLAYVLVLLVGLVNGW